MTNGPNKKSRSGLYVILILIATLLLLCGSPFMWWFGRKSVANRKLEQRIAALRERGMPVDFPSLAAFREQQMSKEKTDRWTEALRTLESETFTASAAGVPIVGYLEDEQTFVPGEEWGHAEDAAAFLKTWSKLRSEIHDVTEETGAIWTPADVNSFFDTLFSHIQNSRTASRLMTLEHIDAVRRDDRQQVFETLLALIGIARSLENEPLMVSQLVHAACLGVALQQLKLSLELDLLDDQQLLRILEQIKQIAPMGDRFRLAIAGERAFGLPVFQDPSQLDEKVPAALGARPIDALATLEIYEQIESINTDSLNAFLADLNGIQQQFDTQLDTANPLRKFDTLLTGRTFPGMQSHGVAMVRSEMQQRIAKAAIGIRLYQHRFGRWPQSLDDLSELDVELGSLQPLGKKPFGFRIVDKEAVLWGFDPQTWNVALQLDTTQTPDDPIDLSTLDEQDRSWLEFWVWRLAPSSAASLQNPSPTATKAK